MKFTDRATVLKAAQKAFINARGEKVEYCQATFITAGGDVVTCGCTQEVLDTVKDRVKVEGVATFEIRADFKGKARLVFLSLEEDKGKR